MLLNVHINIPDIGAIFWWNQIEKSADGLKHGRSILNSRFFWGQKVASKYSTADIKAILFISFDIKVVVFVHEFFYATSKLTLI